MKQTFYSNGKLLLTGEYLVLDGALALALPTKFGQSLIVEEFEANTIRWTSYDKDGSIWLEETIAFETIRNNIKPEDNKVLSTLIDILHHAFLLNPNFLDTKHGYAVTTTLTFPRYWGLGTSSTLLNNIAVWLEIDAFTLLKNSFGGSGYDIACAKHQKPIVYQLENQVPKIMEVAFSPEFKNKLYFVYLNQKQNSRNAIANYYNKRGDIGKFLPTINAITQQTLSCKDSKEFAKLMDLHEIELSSILESATIKEALFPDFWGSIKSLGAWGGDFILVISEEDPTSYFNAKGYHTIVSYSDMILE